MATFSEISREKFPNEQILSIDTSLIEGKIGSIEVVEITSKEISELFAYLYDDMRIVGGTLKKYKEYVHEVLNFAQLCGFISEIPQIKNRSPKRPNLYNKPDSLAIQCGLNSEKFSPSATIIRLAWKAGLLREEIRLLKWNNIDFQNHQIVMPDRTTPLENDLENHLKELYEENKNYSDYVVLSRAKKGPWAQTSISNAAKIFLKKVGQDNVRLNDLRVDFIVNSLQKYDSDFVSYISGINSFSINEHYIPYLNSEKIIKRKKCEITDDIRKHVDEMLHRSSSENEIIAIRFVWKLGIQLQVIPFLKWELVNFEKAEISFSDRTVHLDLETLNLLENIKIKRGEINTHILLTENSSRPVDEITLEKAIRNKLVRSGILGIGIGELYNDYWFSHIDEFVQIKEKWTSNKSKSILPASVLETLLKNHSFISTDRLVSYIKNNTFVTAENLVSYFEMSKNDASLQLTYDIKKEVIKRIGDRYFLYDYELTQSNMFEAVKDYFNNHQPLSLSEIYDMPGMTEYSLIKSFEIMSKTGVVVKTTKEKYALKEYVEEKELIEKLANNHSSKIVDYLKDNRIIDASILSENLNISVQQAKQLLTKLTLDNVLQRHASKYYLKNTVIPNEERVNTIIDFAIEHQPFKSQQAAEVLGLCNEWAKHILINMVNKGELIQPMRNLYCLPQYAKKIEFVENYLNTDAGKETLKKISTKSVLTTDIFMTEFELLNGQANILIKKLENKKIIKRKKNGYFLV